MQYRGIIFDLDGTLVNTVPDIAYAFNTVLVKEGFPSHKQRAYTGFIGWGLRRTLSLALPHPVKEAHFDCLLEEILCLYAKRPATLSTVYSGIKILLEQLTKSGAKMAILSNKNQPLVHSIVAQLLSDFSFTAVQGSTKGLPAKPDPTGLQTLIKPMDLPPSSLLMVGDTAIDKETAVQAGIAFAGVLWGYRTEQELLKAGSSCNFDSPSSLEQWISDGKRS